MKIPTAIFLTLILFFLLFRPNISYAGPYSDDLTKCIVNSTKNERIMLVKWMFAVMSSHPALKPMASVSEKQCKEANKQVAELFMNIFTKSCRQQAQKAMEYEGEIAIKQSFGILGQVAMKEIFSNPDVNSSASGFLKYIDEKKLNSSLGIKKTPK